MIYIATHKKVELPKLQGMTLIQVGAEGKERFASVSDADGDNISSKNPFFCELTAVYWIWKNSAEDYKGLAHYRRFFGKSNLSSSFSDVYEEDDLKMMLVQKDADIVLPYVEYLLHDAQTEICNECCRPEVFGRLRDIVESLTPDYIGDFDAVFKSNKITLFNMMYCRRELFDDYCAWLFPILFELEKSVDMTGYTPYQKRLYGFLSERLLNVWVRHRNLKCVHTPVVQTEVPLKQKFTYIRRRITNRFRFWLRNR